MKTLSFDKCLKCSKAGLFKKAVCPPCIEQIMIDAKSQQKAGMEKMKQNFIKDHFQIVSIGGK